MRRKTVLGTWAMTEALEFEADTGEDLVADAARQAETGQL